MGKINFEYVLFDRGGNRMVNTIEEESLITMKATFSEDKKYRYMLTKIWDKDKPNAVMIGINPSKATPLKSDNTATNAANYFVEEGFGSMTIVNLYSYMCTDPDELINSLSNFESLNNEYIKKACDNAKLIIVAWGHGKNKYNGRKDVVRKILMNYKDKVKCFENKKHEKPQHLRIMCDEWELVDFFE